MPVRILIADDHGVVRKGLRALLDSRRGWKVCAEAANGREAIAKAKTLKPDVAILDIGMPGLGGVEATRQIRKASPNTEVLILSAHGSEKLAREVLGAGALGYLLKEDADHNLFAAVDALRRHTPFFTSKIAEWVARDKRGARAKVPRSVLTPRQRETIQLLAEGKTNKEVAALLHISVKTVETHRANIMLKLDLHSVTDLVHYAIRNEIVHT
ncbi:MAG TPA: response regulator transcription factor [Candidatus Acidoferrales bacterium]|jgi:DNA-binding NarL/FixJ family response regulator|nr:response regulator transcription factor [Candidatus Acidoferrales bacterium]